MRLIDADEYIKKLRERIGIEPTWSHSGLRIAIFELHNMPTIDAVEMVRCKDCRWHEREQPGMVYCPNTVGNWVEDDWYCKGGERREE